MDDEETVRTILVEIAKGRAEIRTEMRANQKLELAFLTFQVAVRVAKKLEAAGNTEDADEIWEALGRVFDIEPTH